MCKPKSPVVPGLEPYELTYAKDQPQSAPLRVLRNPEGIVLSRWALSDEERRLIAEGADLYLSVRAYFQPPQVISVGVSHELDPEVMEREWDLKRELDKRLKAMENAAAREAKPQT